MISSFGEWNSPLSAVVAAGSGSRFGNVHLGETSVMWTESLPSEGGRMSLRFCRIDPATAVFGPAEEFRPGRLVNARSRVNEYGGGSFWRSTDEESMLTYWVDAETQRIQCGRYEGPAEILTPDPPQVRSRRFAAGAVSADGEWIFVERESHPPVESAGAFEPMNDLVAVGTSMNGTVHLVGKGDPGGGDFVVSPKLSPDGTTLAWLKWDHPDMPWDAAELWAAPLDTSGFVPMLGPARRIAGGTEDRRSAALGRAVSVCLPEWSPDGVLWWCDDADDWWHLRHASTPGLPAEGDGDIAARVIPDIAEEVGEPRWVSGGCRYGFTTHGRIVFVSSSGGLDALWVADLNTGERQRVPGPEFSYVESISVCGNRVAAIAGTPTHPTSIWLLDLDQGTATDLRDAKPILDSAWISEPEPIEFATDTGDRCYGLLYQPKNGDHEAPPGELPPLLVRIHGGPTASARSEFSTSVQFWTTRGFAVVEVNYRGSTGYGRKYRDLLLSQWGVADVQDCIAAATHLSSQGIVDGSRCVIRGGSSGGFTALAAICFQAEWGFPGALSAACSLYGVTDLAALARDTHKFESHYLEGLVGAYPEQADVYSARSPLYNASKLDQPVLILQGSEDRIVPQSQAEVLVEAMASNDVPHAYVLFKGEGHGFVELGAITRALETELAFYGVALGFQPAGDLPVVVVDLRHDD